MAIDAKMGPALKSLSGLLWPPTQSRPLGKTDVAGEETGKSTQRGAASEVQASREGLAEITSGRAIFQQGLPTTCQDLPTGGELKAAGGIWSGALPRMSDEEGVMPFETVQDTVLVTVTPMPGKGALGTWRSQEGSGLRAGVTCFLEAGTSS